MNYQPGDKVTGLYLNKYAFTGTVETNRSGYIRQNGRSYQVAKLQVKLSDRCQRPGDAYFEAGETILVDLSCSTITE